MDTVILFMGINGESPNKESFIALVFRLYTVSFYFFAKFKII